MFVYLTKESVLPLKGLNHFGEQNLERIRLMSPNRNLSEEDVKMQFITPAVIKRGWNLSSQIRTEYFFTDGQVNVRGNVVIRGKQKKADYLLFYRPNLPLAVIEAKKDTLSVGFGMQQAIEYAKILDVPFAYSSNGKSFLEHDFITSQEREIPIDQFPSPDELWNRWRQSKNLSDAQVNIVTKPYYFRQGDKTPRYYQRIAINRTLQAIAQGQKRILLVMATGTGKTYTAFHIIHLLWSSGLKKKILYLADRNILIDQTMQNDFKPFEKVVTKVENRKLDSSYEIYMALYHQLAERDDGTKPYTQIQPEFFDLVIVDECHRGSAREDSKWHEILDYFNAATHIGMTATPKETKDISSQNYFGEPVYTYSLKQGIQDGFLAPYKVVRIGLNVDLLGWRPEAGQKDIHGELIEDREYNTKDYDRTLIIDERTKSIARAITTYLKQTDRFLKTIVFCVTIDHAERMRQALVNLNSDMVKNNSNYIMRITGDSPEGKSQLDNFIDVGTECPTIVTTSKLMTTGVDCKTTKLIVLDNNIESMTEFKQIIGRGTRIREDYGKLYFTIMDFRNASRLFADPDFDGEPVVIYEPKEGESPVPPDEYDSSTISDNDCDDISATEGKPDIVFPVAADRSGMYHVKGVDVCVLSKRVQYYGEDGKLITESLIDYTKRNILQEFSSLNDFLNKWNEEDRKQVIIEEFQEHGILLDELKKASGYKDLDDFDLICHIAWDQKPLTRKERANNVKKKGYLYEYSGLAREVLETLLERFANDGIRDLFDTKILENQEFQHFGSPMKIAELFGGRDAYLVAVKRLQNALYNVV